MLCIACLTWKRYDGFLNTLKTYQNNGLLDYANEKIVFAQELGESDKEIAKYYGLTLYGDYKQSLVRR